VAQLQRTTEARGARPQRAIDLDTLMARVCAHVGIAPRALAAAGRTAAASRARVGIAYLWLSVLGHPGRPLAPVLGIRPQNVYRAAALGASNAAEWAELLTTC
jgi:hypothetical protein